MLALMKEMSATLSTVKDKATADAAAEKMAKINEKGEALSKSAQKVQAEMDAAMQARQAELLPIFMGMMTDMQRLQQADFFGSQALKDAMKQTGAAGPEEDVEVEEEVEVEAVPAPAPAQKEAFSGRRNGRGRSFSGGCRSRGILGGSHTCKCQGTCRTNCYNALHNVSVVQARHARVNESLCNGSP